MDSALQDSGLYEKHDATWWADQPGSKSGICSTMPGISWRLAGTLSGNAPASRSVLDAGPSSLRDVFGTVQRDGSNELLLTTSAALSSRDITTTP